jgi:hypothetical protein
MAGSVSGVTPATAGATPLWQQAGSNPATATSAGAAAAPGDVIQPGSGQPGIAGTMSPFSPKAAHYNLLADYESYRLALQSDGTEDEPESFARFERLASIDPATDKATSHATAVKL